MRPTGVWHGNAKSSLVALLVGLVASLVMASGAQASTGTATISGTVSESGTPKEGIRVAAYFAATGEPAGLTTTNSKGEYTVPALVAGSYKVEFFPAGESEYALQYFEEKHTLAEATEVPLAEGQARPGVNANLRKGGVITGMISGNGAPVGNVEVFAFAQGGYSASVLSEADGDYTVKGLPAGSYRIEFYPIEGVNLAPQYFEHGLAPSEATAVAVEEEKTNVIDENLPAGGEIKGTVTDSTTHKPVANATVFVGNARGSEFFPASADELGYDEFAETNANGEYIVLGLPSGSYNLEFEGEGNRYIPQSDNGVNVTQGSTASGVNVALVPRAPYNTAAPVASGTPALGQTLSCSSGSWSGISTISYAYKWLRDGNAIAGATSDSYVVQPADEGHGLSCEVTATNSAGHATAKSNTLSIPQPPPPPPPAPVVGVSTSTVIVSAGGVAHVLVTCTVGPCSGTIDLIQRKTVRHHHGHRTVTRTITIVLGQAPYSLAPGQSRLLVVRLNRPGKHQLDATRHHRMSALLEVFVRGGATVQRPVLLVERRPRRR